MQLISNAGTDRVIDILAEVVRPGACLDVASPALSLFAFLELRQLLRQGVRSRMILPLQAGSDLGLLGAPADRAARNRLQARSIARECASWIAEDTEVRGLPGPLPQSIYVVRDGGNDPIRAIMGSCPMTTGGLGLTPGEQHGLIQDLKEPAEVLPFAAWYESLWQSATASGVRDELLAQLQALADHRPASLIYFQVLSQMLLARGDRLDEEQIVKSVTGIRDTVVWRKLFRFPRDGVVGALDKLNRFGGCIIADSVGLGKTFEALAIIKYHELRNDRVLVLCPKRLRDNWTLYKSNDRRNILASDRFNYDVLNHTDLSREGGMSGDIDLSHVNWGNYDLVVIDESHNFRNKQTPRQGGETRYDRLMRWTIKQDVNNLYKDSEKTGGEKPIDLIRATRPIVIVDEPQSVDGGLQGRGREALAKMDPLCTLRYSATHRDAHHMVYRLDAVDAYERKLVKQIEVAAATVESAHNKPYVRLISVSNRRGAITAKVELDVQRAGGVQRCEKTVQPGEFLEMTTGRDIYNDMIVGEIGVAKGKEFMELRLPGNIIFMRPGDTHGDVDSGSVQRQMIRRTIREHLDKEMRLRPMGIKVLSLFFIDAVDRYRQYADDGTPLKGEYARIFEEEYERFRKHPDFHDLFNSADMNSAAEEVHDGYFSIDKKSRWTDTSESNQGNRENAERAYNLIMKEKEKLLSLDTPLKFIFSHSALREGWDNPNVFQICALREMAGEVERRQTIGRGLRLCVNQEGQRVHGEVNTLTVIAREEYQEFAKNLQREIEEDTGIRFGIVERHQFAALAISTEEGRIKRLGFEQSQVLWEHLRAEHYIDASGKIQDALREAIKQGQLLLPEAFEAQRKQVTEILRRICGKLDVKNADERKQIRTRQAVLHSEEFRALWDRIKHKTTYRVEFDNEELLKRCIRGLKDAPPVTLTRLQWRAADLHIGRGGVEAQEHKRDGASTVVLHEDDIELPDLLTDLQDRTRLTRRSIARILLESGRLEDFRSNPQEFIEIAAQVINRQKQLALVDGIKYRRLGDREYYAQELFEQEELTGYLKNLLPVEKCVYENVVYDSETEKSFAEGLESNEAIKVYAKLPGWFRVPTPLGTYNPDWAVVVEQDGEERVYFVVETKSTLFTGELRDQENAKITCGKAHFTAIAQGDTPAEFRVASTPDDLLSYEEH